MVKFVETDATGLPLKRKQVAHACISCRKRKKRCVHDCDNFSAEENGVAYDSAAPTKPVQYAPQTGETPQVSPTDTRSQISLPSQPESRKATRFVGDLNPEHLFIEATSPHSARDLSGRGGIGVWQSRNSHDARAAPTSTPSRLGPTVTMQTILLQYVHSQCLSCVPTTQDWYALRNIYLAKSDPLYPVLGPVLNEELDSSPLSVLIKQVVCLAAAADPQATPYLRLLPSAVLLSRYEYTSALSTAIHATVESGLITDRVMLIRILLLYSMYMQPTCPEEADMPTAIFAKAAHQFMTLGLQLPMDENDPEYEQMQTLFLSTWALDRMNSAFYGRACTVHERDIGWDFDECIKKQRPPFRLFLSVVKLLEDVINLYRPTQKVEEEPLYIDMPILEQLILDTDATMVPENLLATVEVFYHAVAILSCRFPQDGTKSALPSRANNSRRSLSADRITDIVRDEIRDRLSYMPIIPYAVSLSLSVMYRKMRYSQIPMFRERGLKAFDANTKLLRKLSEIFWCAKTMGGMAEQVLQEMGKAAVTKAQESGSGENSVRDGSDPQPVQPVQTFGAVPRGLPMGSMAPQAHNLPMAEAVPEIDVWGHLDPNFNITAIDAALMGNLDFGTSANWFDWQQNLGFAE
ncbi:fungal specific transcription factor [Seiridium cupressi]